MTGFETTVDGGGGLDGEARAQDSALACFVALLNFLGVAAIFAGLALISSAFAAEPGAQEIAARLVRDTPAYRQIDALVRPAAEQVFDARFGAAGPKASRTVFVDLMVSAQQAHLPVYLDALEDELAARLSVEDLAFLETIGASKVGAAVLADPAIFASAGSEDQMQALMDQHDWSVGDMGAFLVMAGSPRFDPVMEKRNAAMSAAFTKGSIAWTGTFQQGLDAACKSATHPWCRR